MEHIVCQYGKGVSIEWPASGMNRAPSEHGLLAALVATKAL